MNITRQNYEEFFLLYVDNELNIAQRKAVETFVEENPDLRAELIMLQQSILPANEHITFSDKGSLLKTTSTPNPVNETNCEEYFVLYADDELTNEQKDQLEQFVYRNPQYQAAFESLQHAKLMPDTSVVFPDKYALYRSEEDDKAPVIRIRWWRMAAAAAVLLFVGGMGWYMATKDGDVQVKPGGQGQFANNDTPRAKQPVPSVQEQTTETIADKKDITPDEAPEVVTNTDKAGKDNRKINNQSLPKATVPLKAGKTDDMAVVNNKEEKNNDVSRNIPVQSNVPHNEAVVSLKPQDINSVDQVRMNRGSLEQAVTGRELATLNIPATTKPVYMPDGDEAADPEVIYTSNDNKKNRMRGFFRKVSRVFDKTTNADPDHEKSSIRIAAFEIALK